MRRNVQATERELEPILCSRDHPDAVILHHPPSTSTNLHQPPPTSPTSTNLHQPPPTSTNLPNALASFLMSDQLPRLGGLSEPEKYERLVDRVPGGWWSDAAPCAGVHGLKAGAVG